MADAPSTFVPDTPETFVPDEPSPFPKITLPPGTVDAQGKKPYAGYLSAGLFSPYNELNMEEAGNIYKSLAQPAVELPEATGTGTFTGPLSAFYNALVKPAAETLESPLGALSAPVLAESIPARIAAGVGFGALSAKEGLANMQSPDPQTQLKGRFQLAAAPIIGLTGGLEKARPKTFIPEPDVPPIIAPPKISEVKPEVPPSVVAAGESPAAPAVSAAETPVSAGAVPATAEPTPIRTSTQEGVVTPSGPGTIGQAEMGAAGVEEIKPMGTSLKNAVNELERVGLGLQEAPENVKRNMAAAWDKSGQVEAAAPGAGKALADSLVANPERGLTDADSALLLRHKTDLFNKVNDAAERTHIGDEASRAAAQKEYDALSQQYGDLLDAVNKRGSEWGREGRWRQAMVKEDFTFTSTDDMNRYRRTLTGEDLPGDKVERSTRIAKGVKEAKDASDKAQNEVTNDLKAQVKPPTPAEIVKRKESDEQIKAAKKAIDAANKVVRDAAASLAEAETKRRVAKAVRDREVADIQKKAAQKAVASANKLHRQATLDLVKAQRKLQDDPIRAVWTKVQEHIEKGETDPNSIRSKVATDLGISTDRVTRIMGQNPRTKYLMDEAWRKQQLAQVLRQNAKMWVRNLDIPTYEKAISSIPKALFGLKVGFHGTVALGTHAPTVAFQPRFWSVYVRDFGKMYKMVADPAYYERQAQDLVRRKNYITARRAGLVNDPQLFEDFSSPDTAKYFGNITGMGNRGYSVLKILRQDMFDQMYDQLPRSLQVQKGVAEALADQINHATGVVKGYAPRGVNLALFAPRLEAARVMQLAGDPIRAGRTLLNWSKATEGEKLFAQNQFKEKLWIFGTLAAGLALNQGFLNAVGSKQKINGVPKELGGAGFNPLESDFLKFKVAGYDVAYGSAVWNLAKLPVRLGTSLAYHGKGSKLVLEDERFGKVLQDYIRSQASPFAGTTADLMFGRDYAERPLPRAGFGLIPGRTDIPKRLRLHGVDKPYTWGEYAAQQFTPIPISEGIREVWKDGLGMSDKQINSYINAFGVSLLMAGTGTRVTQDKNLEREQ